MPVGLLTQMGGTVVVRGDLIRPVLVFPLGMSSPGESQLCGKFGYPFQVVI